MGLMAGLPKEGEKVRRGNGGSSVIKEEETTMFPVDAADAFRLALPHFLDAFNSLMSALEHVAFRFALLWSFVYGIYRTLISRR
jgi:hypothetical protein